MDKLWIKLKFWLFCRVIPKLKREQRWNITMTTIIDPEQTFKVEVNG